jgi:tagaturonate reductase
MNDLPETVLQFGTGKFLRGFADLFIHEANHAGQAVGRIVVVQSTGDSRAKLINQQRGRYHVLVRGLANGAVVDRVEESASVSRALSAADQWEAVVSAARSPDLRYLISNTTEVGYGLSPADRPGDVPPRAFPAKLLLALKARFEAGRSGVTVLPCELFENNADLLLSRLLQLAEAWRFSTRLTDWLQTECSWRNALVDRIVAGRPTSPPVCPDDELMVVAEPFAFWAIEQKDSQGSLFQHDAILPTPDVRPYFLRKVRILNAAHTALLCKALPRGLKTVREAILDPEIYDWINLLLYEEIVPVLRGRVEGAEEFVRQTLERFQNPFLEHKLSDIASYHESKVKIRLVPTRAEFVEKFGRVPRLLDEAIGGLGDSL